MQTGLRHPYRTVVGAALVGAAITMLVTPKSGKMMRRDLKWQKEKIKVRLLERREQLTSAVHDNKPRIEGSARRIGVEARELAAETEVRARRIGDDAYKTFIAVAADIRKHFLPAEKEDAEAQFSK